MHGQSLHLVGRDAVDALGHDQLAVLRGGRHRGAGAEDEENASAQPRRHLGDRGDGAPVVRAHPGAVRHHKQIPRGKRQGLAQGALQSQHLDGRTAQGLRRLGLRQPRLPHPQRPPRPCASGGRCGDLQEAPKTRKPHRCRGPAWRPPADPAPGPRQEEVRDAPSRPVGDPRRRRRRRPRRCLILGGDACGVWGQRQVVAAEPHGGPFI
mmetsp:Transcript_163898/g.520979  ORF Transcript_163898/g.520979 Transcript_163898/m.520979 type:complete len:209 (-) Transcript_163898:1211-1837(-)